MLSPLIAQGAVLAGRGGGGGLGFGLGTSAALAAT